jgi:S-adenosylmethionine synthetase
MGRFLFTSESVAIGHPDKIADQISDAILDACLKQDPQSRVACETVINSGFIMVFGEITTKAKLDYQELVRETVKDIGYTDPSFGMDYRSCGVIASIKAQSPDIAQGVDASAEKDLGAGDQGLMFGYASDETPELMPLPIMLAHRIMLNVDQLRREGKIAYVRPDGKCQVTVEYDQNFHPCRIHTIVISVQHDEAVSSERLAEDMRSIVDHVTPKGLIDDNTLFFINPTGRFVIGGPEADTGLTGRKIIVDTYGGMAHHGGGCFSGKDPTKVDRSAAYMARYAAKNIVAAGFAKRCEIQVAYAIGITQPVSFRVDTFGTGTVSEELLARVIPMVFDFTPSGIIKMLDLTRPIYQKTAFGGHFGRNDPSFTWEKTDKVKALQQMVKQESFSVS